MPTVLDWNPTVDPSEFIRQVREVLSAGQAVVLPGDSGYVALIDPTAATANQQLAACAQINDPVPAVLAFGPDDAARLGLNVPLSARRLMQRGWPAPLVIALPAERAALPPEWSEDVRARVLADQYLRFRYPDHPVFDGIFPALDQPVLVADTFLPTAEEAIDRLEDSVGLAVSVGPRPTEPRPTVVRVNERDYTIAEAGAMPLDEIQKLTARIVLFVCTGNTCRSPLAEGLAKKLLAERLGCKVDELPARGFWLLSAGTGAFGGAPASLESEAVAAEFGADIRLHRSRPLNPQLLAAADDVIVMTSGHAYAMTANFPDIGPPARLLCGEEDLDDPIGSGLDVYRNCAQTIQRHLERFLAEWVG